jgi:hypothetical protein
MAELEAVSAFLRQQLDEGEEPVGIGLKVGRKLKQDRTCFPAEQ